MNASLERKISTQQYFDSQLIIIGLSTPEYRKLWKDFYQKFGKLSPSELLELGFLFIQSGYFEMQQLGIELLGSSKKTLILLDESHLNNIIVRLDNWACTDNFGVNVLGKCWQLGVVSRDYILNLSSRPGLWERRLSLVACVPLNQKSSGGRGAPEITLKLCSEHIHDREELIVKALSWILRKLAVFEPGTVMDFIHQHRTDLHPLIVREVLNKINTGKKN